MIEIICSVIKNCPCSAMLRDKQNQSEKLDARIGLYIMGGDFPCST